MHLDRRLLLSSGVAAALPLEAGFAAKPSKTGLRIVQAPTRVFKAPDLPREGTEAWIVSLAVESDTDVAPQLLGLETTLFSGGKELLTKQFSQEAAEAMVARDWPPRTNRLNGELRDKPVYWPLVFRMLSRELRLLDIDLMAVEVFLKEGSHRKVSARADISLERYEQKTDLIFPFRGAGIVTQGGAANGGHRNRSGQFAIDAMGLTPNYAMQVSTAFAVNTDLTGYGRELIAPAAGIVVHARGDRPDQPVPGESNEDYHVEELRGAGDPGNHVIIDHGNGEFSMVAHLKAGSLLVAEGQTLTQAQPIGSLGNSGDSFAPHVHHQLQDGPDWQFSNGLPCRFSNISSGWLTRGTFIEAS